MQPSYSQTSSAIDKNVNLKTNGSTQKNNQHNGMIDGSDSVVTECEQINDIFNLKKINSLVKLSHKVSLTDESQNNNCKNNSTNSVGSEKPSVNNKVNGNNEMINNGDTNKKEVPVSKVETKSTDTTKPPQQKQEIVENKPEVVNTSTTERKIGNKFTVKKVELNNKSEKKEPITVSTDINTNNSKIATTAQINVTPNTGTVITIPNNKKEEPIKEEQADNEKERLEAELIDEKAIDHSLDNRFLKFDKIIGRGAFKSVYKGLDTENGVPVAWCELHVRVFFWA